ncbi:MAG: hypothetical protein ACTHK5_04760, partial [Tsuneonella sp.]
MNTVVKALRDAVGAGQVDSDAETRNSRRYDQWAVKHLRDWRGEEVPRPGCVVRPRSVEDVQAVV